MAQLHKISDDEVDVVLAKYKFDIVDIADYKYSNSILFDKKLIVVLTSGKEVHLFGDEALMVKNYLEQE